DFVAGACARGLGQVSLETGVPLGFGVLTTDDEAQARDRAGGRSNKGAEAVLTAGEVVPPLRGPPGAAEAAGCRTGSPRGRGKRRRWLCSPTGTSPSAARRM